MSLEILGVKNAGETNKEYLRLKVLKDCNLRNFAIADLTFDSKGKESNVYRHFFRFPPELVKEGDIIWLYTKAGNNDRVLSTTKVPIHRIFIGSDSTIWNQDGDKVELLQVNTIGSFDLKPKK